MSDAKYRFASWARKGVAGILPSTPDSQALRPSVQAEISFDADRPPIVMDFEVDGPGDVVTFVRDQIVRQYPPENTPDHATNHFVAIDFERADLPWAYTPRSVAPDEPHLQPWIVLAVLEDPNEDRLIKGSPCPRVENVTPGELPALAESWGWAHVQVLENPASSWQQQVQADSPDVTSRLVCSRRLQPNTQYVACIVPATEAGRKAALGLEPLPGDYVLPAWGNAPVTVPVLAHWRFATGPGGDFETLAERLTPRDASGAMTVGAVDFLMDAPGPTLPSLQGQTMQLRGALISPSLQETGFPAVGAQSSAQVQAAFEQGVVDILHGTSQVVRAVGQRPRVMPPKYGAKHAGKEPVPSGNQHPRWLRDVNVDPKARAVAAVGAAVVRQDQEAIMQSAWAQLGDVQEANRLLRQAELAAAVAKTLYEKRIKALPIAQVLRLAGPVLPHCQLDGKAASVALAKQPMLLELASPLFRRATRPGGPMMKRAGPTTIKQVQTLVTRVAGAQIDGPRTAPLQDAITVDLHFGRGGASALPTLRANLANRVATNRGTQPMHRPALARPPTAPSRNTMRTPVVPPRPTMPTGALNALVAALENVQDHIAQPSSPSIDLRGVRETLMRTLEPVANIERLVSARIQVNDMARDTEPLRPIMAYPKFHAPLSEGLARLRPGLFLPGADAIPDDTVTLVETNPRFMEAFMLGANTEIMAELLWRGYPTDQRGTPFRRFWDREEGFDIEEIHRWLGSRTLGRQGGDGEGKLVLIVRGQLFRRYPNTILYARRADGTAAAPEFPDESTATDLFPTFLGAFRGGIHFFGFDLREAEARGSGNDPGWYFVLQEHPTEPRFGLDDGEPVAATTRVVTDWNELHWGQFAINGEYPAYASARQAFQFSGTTQLEWGRDASHIAAISLQRPARVAIHASHMLPGGT